MIQKKTDARLLWLISLCLPLAVAVVLLWSSDSVVSTVSSAEATLVIDAGHGGEDGGAVAPDGILESELNLDIALRLDALARFWGVETRLTRSSAGIEYPASALTLAAKKKADQDARLEIIRSTPGAVLLSIHQNNYPASAPNGIQVFFGPVHGSEALASILQRELTEYLCPNNRRTAEAIDKDIYLMRRSDCPAVLVECGFLSNPEELTRLETDSYRMQLASVMLAAFLEYIRGTEI